MNAQDKFDLYTEGLLNKKEIQELKEQLIGDPVLLNEFKKYIEVNRTLKDKLDSPLLNCPDDDLLKNLNLSQKLNIDEAVNEHFHREKDVLYKGEKDLRENIKRVIQKKSGKRRISNIHLLYKIAALLVLVYISTMVLSKHFNFQGKTLEGSEIFKRYYLPLQDETLKSYFMYNVAMQKAILAFRSADFAEASSKLDELSEYYDTEYRYQILKGLIFLEKGDSKNAKKLLKTAMNNSNTDSRYVAGWYFGLILLNENDLNEARQIFFELSKSENPYSKNAKNILNKVKSK